MSNHAAVIAASDGLTFRLPPAGTNESATVNKLSFARRAAKKTGFVTDLRSGLADGLIRSRKVLLNICELLISGGDFFKRLAGLIVRHIGDHGPDFFRLLTILECAFFVSIHLASDVPPQA